ncbi:MAG: hypothetical protein ABS80_21255 [Pseudonocardia sp. SCN 72-51]|nr:MAG: hypothetical protein ABS80_21255 [Pseudonocardia sp. SCN 72-51]
MAISRSEAAAILSPEQVEALVISPVLQRSVAGQALTLQGITGSTARFPVVKSDPAAAWTAEGAEISASDTDFDEIEVSPYKLAALSVVTNEAASDSNPSAPGIIGAGLVRDLVRKLDKALFSATTTNGPAGLPSLSNTHAVTVNAWADIYDGLVDAASAVESSGSHVSCWLFSPGDAASLAKITVGDDRRAPLFGSVTGTLDAGRTLLGAPLLISDQQPDGIAYAVDSTTAHLCTWSGTEVVADTSAYFTSDRLAIRAKMRTAFAFVHEPGIATITLPDDGGS